MPLCAYAKKETLIILDQSASMYETFINNIKFHYAQKAVISVLNSLKDTDYIGLRTIGMNPERIVMKGFVDNEVLCTATERLNDISPNNRHLIKNSLAGIIPSGTSPIQYVLHTAINNDFSPNADQKEIILITDGYENCNGDPCGYIRQLMRIRNDIKISIISIGASDEDIAGLKCLTSATNGNFINIPTPYNIEQSVKSMMANLSYPEVEETTQTQQVTNTMPALNNSKIIYKNYLMEFNE